ncbi:Uncharacterised protein [Serratia quinivorans]|nr:Uncharacterised protein [Serratia quinivorans]
MIFSIISLSQAGEVADVRRYLRWAVRMATHSRIIRYQMYPFIDIQKFYKKFHKDSNFLTF